jgi:hypothetical protein
MAAFLDLVARQRRPGRPSPGTRSRDAAAAFGAAKAGAGSGVAMLLRYPTRTAPAARTVASAAHANRAAAAKIDGRIGITVIGGGGFAAETLLPAIGATSDFSLRSVVTRSRHRPPRWRRSSAPRRPRPIDAALADRRRRGRDATRRQPRATRSRAARRQARLPRADGHHARTDRCVA